jgi:hypothetical protein
MKNLKLSRKILLPVLLLTAVAIGKPVMKRLHQQHASVSGLKKGDVIFQVNESGQGKAIQLATHSKYTHCGLVWSDEGKLFVWEAGPVVMSTPIDEFIKRGKNSHYVVKRLKGRDSLLTTEQENSMKSLFYRAFYNKPYDLYFGWNDEKIYCSELVWKIYSRTTGIEVGKTEKLRDCDLSHPVVKQKLKERYGNEIPLDETVISPADIFNSELLETVTAN